MKSSKFVAVVSLCVSLLAAAATRLLAEQRRSAVATALPGDEGRAGTRSLGQLNSFALGLLLGGLRGPLVMALWSSSDRQKTERNLENFDTRVELIRLLQPQFDSVHLYQIWNKAYNISVEMANLASKYTAILDAVDYGRKVIAERPANIDLETQLGEVFNNKLGGSQESDYYRLRIHEETQADEPAVKITFPATREEEFRKAALRAGVSPRQLQVRRTEDPALRVAAVRASRAEPIRSLFGGSDVTYRQLAPRQTGARGVSGPQRLEPMLDAEGNLLADPVTPRDHTAATAGGHAGRGDQNGVAEFLAEFGPFPEGLSPHALAYHHFMNAYLLQEEAGQRHIQHSEAFVHANPGRALRDWALSAATEGRLLEAEAYGLDVNSPGDAGQRQADLERAVAGVTSDTPPTSPELLRQAMQQYARALQVSERAIEWIERHVTAYPAASSTFESNLGRMRGMRTLLEADLLYDRLLMGDVDDRNAARDQAERLYLDAHRQMLDFIMRHHAPAQFLPPGVRPQELLHEPIWVKWQVLDALRQERDVRPLEFDHTNTLTEYDGYFDRIRTRLSLLRSDR